MPRKKMSGGKRFKQTGSSNRSADKRYAAKKPSAAERRANRTDRGKRL